MTKAQRKTNIFTVLSIAVLAMLICVFFMVGCGSAKNSTSEDTEYTTDPVQVYGVRFKDGVKQSDVNRIKDSYDLDYHEENAENQSRQIDTDAEEYVEEEYDRQIETEDSSDSLSSEEIAAENALVVRVARILQGKTDLNTGEEIKIDNSTKIEVVESPTDDGIVANSSDSLPIYPSGEGSNEEIAPQPVYAKSFATLAAVPVTTATEQQNNDELNDVEPEPVPVLTAPQPEPAPEENQGDIYPKDNTNVQIKNQNVSLLKTTDAERSRDVILLARLIYGEARNIANRAHWAGVCWCALNRLDTGKYGDTLLYVLTKTNKDSKKRADQQFTGFSRTKPSSTDLDKYTAILEVAQDVYEAWEEEQKTGIRSDRRTLDEDYLYYWGDESYNYFVKTAEERRNKDKTNAWNWTLGNPYDQELKDKISKYVISDGEMTYMAKQLWHKARGLKSKMERAAVIWCILNRLESPVFEDSILEILKRPLQFSDINTPGSLPDSSYMELVKDVVARWNDERAGKSDVGRVLPKSYIYFHGTEDESENLYYNNPYQKHKWRWELEDPYTHD